MNHGGKTFTIGGETLRETEEAGTRKRRDSVSFFKTDEKHHKFKGEKSHEQGGEMIACDGFYWKIGSERKSKNTSSIYVVWRNTPDVSSCLTMRFFTKGTRNHHPCIAILQFRRRLMRGLPRYFPKGGYVRKCFLHASNDILAGILRGELYLNWERKGRMIVVRRDEPFQKLKKASNLDLLVQRGELI